MEQYKGFNFSTEVINGIQYHKAVNDKNQKFIRKTVEEVKARIDAYLKFHEMNDNIVKHMDFIEGLYCRYQDEKEYEDINDYKKPITDRLGIDASKTKMTKRPFGFKFDIDGIVMLHLAITGRKYKVVGKFNKKKNCN